MWHANDGIVWHANDHGIVPWYAMQTQRQGQDEALPSCTRFLRDLPPCCSRGQEEGGRIERMQQLGARSGACQGHVTSDRRPRMLLGSGAQVCGGAGGLCLRGAHAMSHVVAVEDGCVRDVTRRYVRRWEDVVAQRMDDKHGTLQDLLLLLSRRRVRVEEDSVLEEEQRQFWALGLAEELPTSAAAFAVSPYFALLGHLRETEMLRYRALDHATLVASQGADAGDAGEARDGRGMATSPWPGLILGTIVVDGQVETIISRQYVAVLRTREEWSRRLCTVRQGERAVRLLKHKMARMHKQLRGPDSTLMQLQRASLCELFGAWQVDVLHIGRAVNGTVPKNARGHVELLGAYHLPHGCAHVLFASAALAARRLKVDYAPALVGWVLRGGRSLPLFQGIVVCAEHAHAVSAACRIRAQGEMMGLTEKRVASAQLDEEAQSEGSEGEYEKARRARISHNKQVLANLGIVSRDAQGGGGERSGLEVVEAQGAAEVMTMWGDVSLRVLKCFGSSCSSGGVGEQEAQASGEAIVVAPSVLAVLSSLELELVSCDPAYPARSDSDGGRVRFEDRAAASAGREDDAKALAKASMMRVLLPAPSVAPSVASGSFCCVL